ncbi:MAG: hypothetical protein ABI683_01940 [Ginsengibacter sp.]
MQVYADMVLNHTNGADETEINLFDGQRHWRLLSVGVCASVSIDEFRLAATALSFK